MSASSPPPNEARFWTVEGASVRCSLCPHGCLLDHGQTGLCNVRQARGNVLYSLVYGHPVGGAVDPIEKKPLFHFYPGSSTLSYATVGCNLACTFCQNYSLSQVNDRLRQSRSVPPALLVDEAASAGVATIAHTYSEPTIFVEYALDVAREANRRGIHNAFVTNGFIHGDARQEVAATIQAANIDLKAFSDATYRTVCRGRLQPVLDTIEAWHAAGIWLEVTTLVVPGLNDSREELTDIARFLAALSPDIPWHVSRFHPDYHMRDRSLTPESTLHVARDAGREAGLNFVYVGNLAGDDGENTRCPGCLEPLISRHRFTIESNVLNGASCPHCSTTIPGHFHPTSQPAEMIR